MAKLGSASEYVARWRQRGHPPEWIARQVADCIRGSWRGWTLQDYALSPKETACFAVLRNEPSRRQQRRQQAALEQGEALRERQRRQDEIDRTAILAAEVCTALGCTMEELARWKNTRRIPPDGKRGRVHAWLPATVESAMAEVAAWRREDATRTNPAVSVAGLKARGWTDGLIRTFLGEPDRLARNPHYSSAGAPMRLYLLQRVEDAERIPAFIERRARVAAQQARRKAAAVMDEAADRAMIGSIYKSMLPH